MDSSLPFNSIGIDFYFRIDIFFIHDKIIVNKGKDDWHEKDASIYFMHVVIDGMYKS